MKRVHYRPEVSLEGGGDFLVSGALVLASNRLFKPKAEELRAMLHDIRDELNLSVPQLAGMLGVSHQAARKWFDGSRNPTGSACRLIWLLHARLFAPAALDEPGGWFTWRRVPKPRGHLGQGMS